MKITVADPKNFGAAEISDFRSPVLKSDQVAENGLEGRIRSAYYLATISIENRLVAIGAIKNNPVRREKYQKNSGVNLPVEKYLGEFGWLYVCADQRRNGLGDILTMALIASAKPRGLYSTVRASNLVARRFHERRGFMSAGFQWRSDSGDDCVILYLHL